MTRQRPQPSGSWVAGIMILLIGLALIYVLVLMFHNAGMLWQGVTWLI